MIEIDEAIEARQIDAVMQDRQVRRRVRLLVKRITEIPAVENPSPSGDPYFLNPENIATIERGARDIKEGRFKRLTPELRKELFGDL